MKQIRMSRLVPLEQTRDREFDRIFWSQVEPKDRFKAGWQLVEDYLSLRGRSDEQRLRRTVAVFRKLRS